ncbi:MAG TPA: hypothetical protein VGC79_19160 [Polyangiaceae bacterium]
MLAGDGEPCASTIGPEFNSCVDVSGFDDTVGLVSVRAIRSRSASRAVNAILPGG